MYSSPQIDEKRFPIYCFLGIYFCIHLGVYLSLSLSVSIMYIYIHMWYSWTMARTPVQNLPGHGGPTKRLRGKTWRRRSKDSCSRSKNLIRHLGLYTSSISSCSLFFVCNLVVWFITFEGHVTPCRHWVSSVSLVVRVFCPEMLFDLVLSVLCESAEPCKSRTYGIRYCYKDMRFFLGLILVRYPYLTYILAIIYMATTKRGVCFSALDRQNTWRVWIPLPDAPSIGDQTGRGAKMNWGPRRVPGPSRVSQGHLRAALGRLHACGQLIELSRPCAARAHQKLGNRKHSTSSRSSRYYI